MKVFKYFTLTKEKRTKLEEPKDRLTWIKHGLSEFIGTFLLSLSLAGLSIMVAGTNKEVASFMLHPILIGFYAGFIAVGGVLFIFLRWSCDLNPAVTITRMLQGQNTTKYGLYKIGIQFVAGILTGIVIYAFGQLGSGAAANKAISSIDAAKKSFGHIYGWSDTQAAGATWIFFVELIITSLLLFPIFTGMIKDKYRDFAIMFIISMAVWMGVLGGTASLNPARGIAQQVPGLFFGPAAGSGAGSMSDIVSATFAMEAGTLLAPFFYVFSRGLLTEYVNPFIAKVISFKNVRTTEMKIISSNEIKKNNYTNKKSNKKAKK